MIQIHAWKTSNILVWLYLFEYIRPRVICQTIFDKLSWNIATKWNFSQTFSIVFVIYWLQIDVIIKTLQHRGLQVIKNIKRWKVEIGLESKCDRYVSIYRLDGSRMSHIVLCKTRLIVKSILLSLEPCVLRWKDLPVKQISAPLPLTLVIFQTLSGLFFPDVDWWQKCRRIKASTRF